MDIPAPVGRGEWERVLSGGWDRGSGHWKELKVGFIMSCWLRR